MATSLSTSEANIGPVDGRSVRAQRRREVRKEQILAAAKELFARRGYRGYAKRRNDHRCRAGRRPGGASIAIRTGGRPGSGAQHRRTNCELQANEF